MSDFINSFFGSAKPQRKRKSTTKSSTKTSKSVKSGKSKKDNDYKFQGIKKSKTDGKKYDAIFVRDDGKEKLVSFGKSGEKDYTQHQDKELREFFLFKNKDKKFNDLMSSSSLNRWILYEKKSLDSAVSNYKKMFNK